jgi:isopenicillin N synthase-like dioxygenase
VVDRGSTAYDRLSVEFEQWASPGFATSLVDVLTVAGVAVLRGVWSTDLESSALAALESLFAQPENWKKAHRAAEPQLGGFIEYGRTHAADTGVANLLEAWCLSAAFGGPAQGIPGWNDLRIGALELHSAAMRVIDALDRGLLAMGSIKALVDDRSHELYSLYYPKRLLGQVQGAMRQSLHADSSICSLLPRATCPGLLAQIGPDLIPLHPLPGDLVLVSGVILEYLTAGRMVACRHTVETPPDRARGYDRVSLVYFIEARSNAVIAPLPTIGYKGTGFPALPVKTLVGVSHGKVYGKQ